MSPFPGISATATKSPEFALTAEEAAQLEAIRVEARARFEKWKVQETRRRALEGLKKRDFPLSPFECSWAYEQQFTSQLPRFRDATGLPPMVHFPNAILLRTYHR